MTERKKREKVVAEITVAHLTQVANESGRSLSAEEAVEFLNQHGRAHEMWKHMMLAAEAYIKASLSARSPMLLTQSGGVRRRVAV
jgi:purine nucleoside phosphorylase